MTTTEEKPTSSKAGVQATCSYRKKNLHDQTQSSTDWLKHKEQPHNERRQFTSPDKSAGNPMDLDLSLVSNDDVQCNNTAEGKPVHTNIDAELQLLPKELTLTQEPGIKIGKNKSVEPQQTLRRSQRVPFVKPTEKLGGVPYCNGNNKQDENVQSRRHI